MGFVEEDESDWDREDPVNAGVISDKRVTTLSGRVLLRWIVYEDPKSGETYEFVTTEMTIRPGLLAWTYKCRWHIGKRWNVVSCVLVIGSYLTFILGSWLGYQALLGMA